MKFEIFPFLGRQLRGARKARKMTQPDVALRLNRDQARISELERDLINNRLGRDRLTLMAEMCDVLDLVPVLVPRNVANAVLTSYATNLVGGTAIRPGTLSPMPSTFDDVFVDLSDDGDD